MSHVSSEDKFVARDGATYEAVDAVRVDGFPTCRNCAFIGRDPALENACAVAPPCMSGARKDGRAVVFMKVKNA